jgi:hypothetical protein
MCPTVRPRRLAARVVIKIEGGKSVAVACPSGDGAVLSDDGKTLIRLTA